jgi:hypothetical protein
LKRAKDKANDGRISKSDDTNVDSAKKMLSEMMREFDAIRGSISHDNNVYEGTPKHAGVLSNSV